jgi:sulfhydrogenase subunit alpha
MTRTIVVDHLARIEGHAGITVTIDGDRVNQVQFDIFEGIRLFEGLVRGRPVVEVAGIVSRICAICSGGHAITALQAIERAMQVEVSPQTERLRELAFHGAAIESHALHVFCLALPDFLQKASVIELAGVAPDAVAMALRLKKLGNTIQEVVGGRAVHPVNYAIGGFCKVPAPEDLRRLRAALMSGLADCESAVNLLRSIQVPAVSSDPIRCAAIVPHDHSYFFGTDVRLSDDTVIPVDEYRTLTNERAVPHSTAKHSLAADRPYMVGALARLALNGDRITGRARDAWVLLGPALPCRNVIMNDVAQLVELVFSVEQALHIVETLLTDGLIAEPRRRIEPKAGRGAAASEVPRGILFHSYEIDRDGRVAAADVITPTAQNLANLEDQLRAAVRDAGDADDETLRHRLEMVARAYDPCVSCSVHAVEVQSAKCKVQGAR